LIWLLLTHRELTSYNLKEEEEEQEEQETKHMEISEINRDRTALKIILFLYRKKKRMKIQAFASLAEMHHQELFKNVATVDHYAIVAVVIVAAVVAVVVFIAVVIAIAVTFCVVVIAVTFRMNFK